MASLIDISVLGDKKLQKKLDALAPKVQKKATKKALRDGAKLIHREAKNRAPVDSGALRAGLRVRAARTGRNRDRVAILVRTPTRSELRRMADTTKKRPKKFAAALASRLDRAERQSSAGGRDWYYPAIVEYGYTANGRTVPPNPYLRGALKSKRNDAIRVIRQSLWTQIRSIARLSGRTS